MKYLLPIALVFSLGGCVAMHKLSGLPVNNGNGYIIESSAGDLNIQLTIEYEDHELIAQQRVSRLKNSYAPESEISAAVNMAPKGGAITVRYENSTIEATNTKWLEYIVFKDEIEILRQKGRDKIANIPADQYRLWWNTDLIWIEKDIKPPFKLVVVNNLLVNRTIFNILPKDNPEK